MDRPHGKVGRPSKRTPALVKKICDMLARGLNYTQASEAAGITRDTLYLWSQNSPSFSNAVKRAIVEGIDRRLKRIERAAKKGNWQADAWWLERVCKEQFARPQSVEVYGRMWRNDPNDIEQQGKPDVSRLSPEERAALKMLLEKARVIETPVQEVTVKVQPPQLKESNGKSPEAETGTAP